MTHDHAPDVVYVVKEDENNEELRHSFRSLANLPHGRVWIAGYRPSWVVDEVGVIPVRQRGTKWANSSRNMLSACRHPEVSQRFVYFNDDFFVMRPVDAVPVFNRGPARDVLGATPGSRYRRGGYATAEWLRRQGYADPLSYELHLPIVLDKTAMIDVIEAGVRDRVHPFHKRTAYGNLMKLGGDSVADCKVADRTSIPGHGPFASTAPEAFAYGRAGALIRATFDQPCRYEKPGSAPPVAAEPEPDPGPPPDPPDAAAGRGEWVNYAVASGADRAEARRLTRAALIDRFGGN
jgi:hypothetical protein